MTDLRRPSSASTAPIAPATTPATGLTSVAVGIAVGVALLAGGAGGYALGRHRSQSVETETAARAVARAETRAAPRPALPSAEQQTATRRLGVWNSEALDPLAEVDGPVSRFELPLQLSPPFDAVDATLFDSLDSRIRLAHATPVGRSELCADFDGTRTACGLKGRATLQNFLLGKTVECVRLFLSHDERRKIIDARCRAGGEDLALHQIRAGYAFPNKLADADHLAALAEAQSRRVGVWSGPYVIPSEDRSEEDARDVPFGSLRLPTPTP